MNEGLFLWICIGFYIAAFVGFLTGFLFKSEAVSSVGWKAFLVSLGAHTLAITVRWVASGHPPVYGIYEHALASGWCIALIFAVASLKVERARHLGIAIAPLIMLLLGYGIMTQGRGIEPLPPSYRSNWLWVHVAFAWLAYSAFAVTAAAAVLYLFKTRFRWNWLEKLPSLEKLDELNLRIIIIGFIALTIEMGAGALWAYGLWGRYWGWDPMETWTLLSWVLYALIIHLRFTMKYKGSKMAWLCIIAFIVILIAFGGIAMMFGLHQTMV